MPIPKDNDPVFIKEILGYKSIDFGEWLKSLDITALEKLEEAYTNNIPSGHILKLTKPYIAYHIHYVALRVSLKVLQIGP